MGRPRGRPPKPKLQLSNGEIPKLVCNCGNTNEKDFYKSDSVFHDGIGKIPYCKKCIDKLYRHYVKKYEDENYTFPEKKAVKRLCMAFDLYWGEEVFDTAVKQLERMPTMTMMTSYIKASRLSQHCKKNYDNTLEKDSANNGVIPETYAKKEISDRTIKLFGSGFSHEDYRYLQEQYDDWTSRHECQTKSQEEIFKRICFKQLEILKAQRKHEDTKDLDASLLKMLEAAKLQPKQNRAETISDTQTFGTLIDKWENTRPIPECDPELKDVDRIGKYINIFFKGHLAKMMNLKGVFCKAYDDFMSKYSVQKPEYESEDSNSEALFDAIFGGDLDDC